MTRPSRHIWRLLKWGRTAARHGALRGIESDPNTPAPVKRLVRLARFGTRQPATPDYAGAFRAIGPAAIKLGQTLATRPDLVGEEAANDLLRLQDALPPVPFETIRAQIEQSFGRPLEALYARFDEGPVGAASIAQVHRALTTDGRDVAVKVIRPGVIDQFNRDIQTYEWAAAHVEQLGGEIARLRPRLVIANMKRWTARELDLRREAASASELAEAMEAMPGYRIPAIDWDRTTGKVINSIGHNYACCRFTLSEPYVLGSNMDMIDLSQNGKLVSTGPAIDSRECLGAVVSNGRIFYTSQASGFIVSQTFGKEAENLRAVWERP